MHSLTHNKRKYPNMYLSCYGMLCLFARGSFNVTVGPNITRTHVKSCPRFFRVLMIY